MPSLAGMADLLERLESKVLHVNPVSCVKVRHRNANCTRCADACPSGAISVANNVVNIEAQKCLSCGSCAVVCPTDAIEFMRPTYEELKHRIHTSVKELHGEPVVVCARAAAHNVAHADKVVQVPCISRIDTATLLEAAVAGASKITIVDANCSTCKLKRAARNFQEVEREITDLLCAWNNSMEIIRTCEVPLDAQPEDEVTARGGVSRRGFFTDMKASVKSAASEALTVTIENEIGAKKEHESISSQLRIRDNGRLAQVSMPRHEDIMEDLFELGEPVSGTTIMSTHWGSLIFDPDKCNMCGICATFCPDAALSRVVASPDESVPAFRRSKIEKLECLEFRLADCVACHLCESVCMHHAITISDEIECDDILEFEPRELRGSMKRQQRMW